MPIQTTTITVKRRKKQRNKFKKIQGKKKKLTADVQTTNRKYISQANKRQLLYYSNQDFIFLKNHIQYSNVVEKNNDVVHD